MPIIEAMVNRSLEYRLKKYTADTTLYARKK